VSAGAAQSANTVDDLLEFGYPFGAERMVVVGSRGVEFRRRLGAFWYP
jgi:hypothetical protein